MLTRLLPPVSGSQLYEHSKLGKVPFYISSGYLLLSTSSIIHRSTE